MIPPGYSALAQTKEILATLKADRDPVLITGEAGTGKSTLVSFLRRSGKFPATAVLAPTGIAALTIGGQTIHSFFRLPPRLITPETIMGQRSNHLWKKIKHLVLDEISMVRPDVLDGIDYILRRARKNEAPFGGVKVIFVGDFYQLPPVVRGQDAQMLAHMGYETPFVYSAHVFKAHPPRLITLSEVHRQSQLEFLDLLSDIRLGKNIAEALASLNAACTGPHRAGKMPLLLCATNSAANGYNGRALAHIETRAARYDGTLHGKFNVRGDKLPVPEELSLKVGARVMALKNDPARRYVNGSLGSVVSLFGQDGTGGKVTVKFDHNGKRAEIEPAIWETVKYVWDEAAQDIKTEIVGSYQQIPLALAWAVTIHKSQGLTLEDVRVDLERGAFASGQAYVALSRATTLEGLSLSRPLRERDIIVERAHEYHLGEHHLGKHHLGT